jgi:hypothetical protein
MPVTVEIVWAFEKRVTEPVGYPPWETLAVGETTYQLVLRFPDGTSHLVRASREAVGAYEALSRAQATPTVPPLPPNTITSP